MPIALQNFFDMYSYRARVLPALLTLLPVFLTALVLYPIIYSGIGAAAGSLAVACGVLWFFANVVRARGRGAERTLLAKWDGLPTTRMLRHRDSALDEQTKARYHSFLSSRVRGLRLPNLDQERKDPNAADSVYRSSVKWLLEFTRNRTLFPLVFSENISYGFRRNLFAAKSIGLGLTFLCLVLLGLRVVRADPSSVYNVPSQHLFLGVLLLAIAACWALIVTEVWVADASQSFAVALLAACDSPTSDANLSLEKSTIAH
jgi:hypothetical protein